MDDMNLSKWGTRVYWVIFALFLIIGGLGTAPRNLKDSVSVLGLMVPWKYVFAGVFFASLGLAYIVAKVIDDVVIRRLTGPRPETNQLEG